MKPNIYCQIQEKGAIFTGEEKREKSLGGKLHCVSHSIRRALDATIAAQVSPELTGMRSLVLGCIVRCYRAGEPVYQRDLETNFHIRRSSITTLLQAMEQGGFIRRNPVAADARLKSLEPTEKGLAYDEAIKRCIDGFERELRRGLGEQQLAALNQMLDSLMENVRQMETQGSKTTGKEE